MYSTDIPIMPIPTTVSPITVPLLNATRRPGLSPTMDAAAVLVLALTAMLIPT